MTFDQVRADLELRGRTAIVTGGASGIGRAIAISFAAQGAQVVIAARDADRGATVVNEIARRNGRAVFIETDVSRSDSVSSMVERAASLFGSLEVVVNNSGIETEEGQVGPSEVDWDRMFETNTKGTWLCCKAAMPYLLQTQGAIINNASMAGLLGVAGSVGYAASKAAVVSLSKSLALAYADQGVRVNVVCPGPVDTQMTYDEWDLVGGREEGLRRALALSPARRISSPDEVADLVRFLASDRARSITGAVIPIDGGKTAGLMPANRYRW